MRTTTESVRDVVSIGLRSGALTASSADRHIYYAVPPHSVLAGVGVTHHAAAELAELASAFPTIEHPLGYDSESRSLLIAFADGVRL